MPLLSLASRCSTALLLAVMLSSSHDTDGLLLPRKSLAAAAFQKRARSNTALSSQPQQDDDKGRVWRKFFVPYQEAVDSQNAPTSYMVNREDEDEEMTYASQQPQEYEAPAQIQEERQQQLQQQMDRDDEAIARQTAAQFQGIPLDLHSQSDDRDPRLAQMEITRPRTAFRPRHSPGAVVYDSSRPEFQSDYSPNPTTLSTASDATPQESLKQANLHHIPPPERPNADDLPDYVQENAGSTLVPTLASASQANVASTKPNSSNYRSQSAQQLQNSVTYDQQYINVNAPSSMLPSEGSLHKQAQAKKEARPLRTPFQPRAKPAGAQVYNFQAYPEETDTEPNALPVDEIQPTVHPDQHSFDTTQSVSTMSSSIGLQSEGSYQQQQDKGKELSQPKTPFQSNRHKGAIYYSPDDPTVLEGVNMPFEEVKKKPFDPSTDSVSQAPLSFGMQSEGNYHRQKESKQEIKFNKTPFRPRRHEGARNYLDDQTVLEGVNMPFEEPTKKPFDPSTDSVSQAPLAFGMQSEGNYHQTKESNQEIKFNKTPFRARRHEGARNYLEDQEQARQRQQQQSQQHWDPSQSVSAAPLSLGLSSEGSLQRELEQQREMSFNRTPFQGRKVAGAKKYLDEQEDASEGNQKQEWDRSQSVSAAPLSLGMQSEGTYHKEKEAKQEMSFNKTPFQGRKVEGAKKYLDEQGSSQDQDLNWDRSQSVSAAPLSLGMQSEGNYHKEKEAKQEMSFNKTPFQGRKVEGATKWLEQNIKDNDGYNFDRASSVSSAPNSLGLQSEASYQSNEAKKINKEVSPIRTPFTSRKVKGAEKWLEKQQEELNDYNFDRSQSVSTAENTIGLMNDVALQAKQGKQMDDAKIKTPFRGRKVDGARKYLVDGPIEQQDDEAPPAHVINSSQNLGIESDVTRAPKLEKDGPQQNRTPFRPPKNAGSVLFDPSTYDPYAEEQVDEGSPVDRNHDFVPLDGMPKHRPATKKGTGVDGDSGDVTIHHDSSNVRMGEASKPKTPFEFNRPDGATRQVYDTRETREVANSGMTSIFADHDVRLKKRSERDTPMSPFRPARGTGRIYAPSSTDIEPEEPEQRTFFDSDARQHYQAEKEANKPITPFKLKRTGTAHVYDPSNLKQEQEERAVASSGYSSINMDNNSKMHTKSETGRPITPFDVKDKVNAAKRTGQSSYKEQEDSQEAELHDEVDVGEAPFSVHRTASSVNVQGAYKSQLPTDTIPSRNRNPLHTDLREAGYQERSDSAVSPASSQEQMQELRTHSESKPSTSLSDVLPANFTSSSPGGTFSDSVSTYDG